MDNPNFFWYVLSPQGYKVAAFDMQKEALAYARQRGEGYIIKQRSELNEERARS